MKILVFLATAALILFGAVTAIPGVMLAETPTPSPSPTPTTITPSPTATPTPTASPTPTPPASVTPIPSPAPEKIDIRPTYPAIQNTVGSSFTFEMMLYYSGENPKIFDLSILPPKGWDAWVNPQFDTDTKISSIRFNPTGPATKVNVVVSAPLFPIPDPGNYKFTFNVVSGNVKGSVDLTAVLIPQYTLYLVSSTDQTAGLSMTAQAGKDNFYSVKVQNLGTGDVNNITITATSPKDWTISYSPSKVDSLPAFEEKAIDVDIKPGASIAPGDYIISLTASGAEAIAQKIDLRVTVESAGAGAWIGVGVIVVIVAGLIVGFLRFTSR